MTPTGNKRHVSNIHWADPVLIHLQMDLKLEEMKIAKTQAEYTSTVKQISFQNSSTSPHYTPRQYLKKSHLLSTIRIAYKLSYKGTFGRKTFLRKFYRHRTHLTFYTPALTCWPGFRFGRAFKHIIFIDGRDASDAENSGTNT